jgi:hypothetical protein
MQCYMPCTVTHLSRPLEFRPGVVGHQIAGKAMTFSSLCQNPSVILWEWHGVWNQILPSSGLYVTEMTWLSLLWSRGFLVTSRGTSKLSRSGMLPNVGKTSRSTGRWQDRCQPQQRIDFDRNRLLSSKTSCQTWTGTTEMKCRVPNQPTNEETRIYQWDKNL